jgi:hypothetical protein
MSSKQAIIALMLPDALIYRVIVMTLSENRNA